MSGELASEYYISCKKCGIIATSDAATRKVCPICKRPVRLLSQKEIKELEELM